MVDFPVILVRKLGTDGTDTFADVVELIWVRQHDGPRQGRFTGWLHSDHHVFARQDQSGQYQSSLIAVVAICHISRKWVNFLFV